MSDNVDSLTVGQLVQELNEVTEWQILGKFLGLSMSVIKEIDRDNHDTASKRLAMFDKWLRNEVNPSWEKVVQGLKKMSELRLANRLKNKYCKEQGKGTSEKLLAERELKIDRNETIAQNIDDFGEKYLKLVIRTESTLEDIHPSGINVKRFSQCYMSVELEITTVEQLFDRLKPFHFLNYLMLEKIIKFFLSHDQSIVSALIEYIRQLEYFKKSTTVQQFMESIEAAQQPPTTEEIPSTMCNVTLRLMGQWLEKTMEDLDLLVKEIFQDKVVVLTHLRIKRGSVIVTYRALQSEFPSLLLYAVQKTNFLSLVGVRELSVGHVVIPGAQADFSFEKGLFTAVLDDEINTLRFLLNIRTSPNTAVVNGETALTLASFLGKESAVKALLEANANPNFTRYDGIPPILAASKEGHTGIVKLLLNANASLDRHTDKDGRTALFYACEQGHSKVVSLLLKASANPNVFTHARITPIFMASQYGYSKVVSLLLKFNADPNFCQIIDGVTPLLIASQFGHSTIVSLLLKSGVNPNQQSKTGITALSLASLHGHCDVVNILLKANANPNLQDDNGFSPLHAAAQSGHSDVIRILLKAHANPNLRSKEGRTPLVISSTRHYHHVLKLLLTGGADPDIPLLTGATALMMACFVGCLECVELLLMYGADPNMMLPSSGITALHTAAFLGLEDIVDLLQAVKLSQSSSTSNVLTAAEVVADVDNEALSAFNRDMEKMLVDKAELLISSLYSKYDKSLPPKFKQEVQRPVV